MSQHWWFVSVAWGLGAVLFGALLADTLRRQSAARRRLALLETRRPSGRTSP
ncbi:heme exporter protein CcmD [Roseomonas haemaphysalidis]|uniref:Heme exporter protein D n=1 Tax=Roseomonas haemaphysalidis TaxID=2768162 RepID=A0ABS3KT63_9PROT|nr:heme exporter protein CcmD [Roseomonas haemaphysalidis]MBO1080636.1 heme exporter protein CcmD [Roseomonas haemaphysalidis]